MYTLFRLTCVLSLRERSLTRFKVFIIHHRGYPLYQSGSTWCKAIIRKLTLRFIRALPMIQNNLGFLSILRNCHTIYRFMDRVLLDNVLMVIKGLCLLLKPNSSNTKSKLRIAILKLLTLGRRCIGIFFSRTRRKLVFGYGFQASLGHCTSVSTLTLLSVRSRWRSKYHMDNWVEALEKSCLA